MLCNKNANALAGCADYGGSRRSLNSKPDPEPRIDPKCLHRWAPEILERPLLTKMACRTAVGLVLFIRAVGTFRAAGEGLRKSTATTRTCMRHVSNPLCATVCFDYMQKKVAYLGNANLQTPSPNVSLRACCFWVE